MIAMKIIRNIIAISLALSLISGINRRADGAAAAAEQIHICDHSACEAALAEARKSFDLILRIEIELIPGLFGDWAVIQASSGAIEINAAAAESLAIGQDISEGIAGSADFLAHIIDCRIIVESIAPHN